MTKPRYQHGCVAGSQAHRIALAGSPSNAWNLNFNNGNSNNNHRNNNGFGLAVASLPASEYQGAVTLTDLRRAYQAAARQKCSANQMIFENHLTDNLIILRDRINSGAWSPSRPICMTAIKPKIREIHAPDFADRVVHHLLVPYLEPYWESKFIYDSYANRVGKGTLAAVQRVYSFSRQVESGDGDGWYLQLDVKNFFNSIPRGLLWQIVKKGMLDAGVDPIIQKAVHTLLRQHPLANGVRYQSSPAELALVPAHKRLANSRPGCGIPIGNLTSQFFANVLLNKLDQFVKHVLRVPRYARYVDDFVLIHKDRVRLEQWRQQIEDFLRDELQLELKADQKLRPLKEGIDFLGYIIYPNHMRVRQRVISHAREKLWMWEQMHVTKSQIRATPEHFRQIKSVWSSYRGHFEHASTRGLTADLNRQFPWLDAATRPRRFHPDLEGRHLLVPLIAISKEK